MGCSSATASKPLYGVGDAVRRYHGYYFSWAIIYTFWYHPVEMTSGHLAGFAYMMLLLLQCSLFFTRFHTNRWWTVSLEFLFVIHGSMVAYFIMNQPGRAPWAYFLFGGMSTFLIIQMHGLGLSTKAKLAIAAPLVLGMVAFYIWIGAPGEILGIPNLTFIMYAGTAAVALVVWILMGVAKLAAGPQNQVSGTGA